jgi:hypothetical protein
MSEDRISPLFPKRFIEGNDKLMLVRFFARKPNGIDGKELTRGETSEPRERPLTFHGSTESNVVVGVRICSSPLIAWIAVWAFAVVVRPVFRSGGICGADCQSCLEARHSADPTHVLEKRDLLPFE